MMAGPNARLRDSSPSSRGPAPTPAAMPRNTAPNSRPYAAWPPPSTVTANSCPCAMIAPPAASEPSMPTSSPRISGVCRANATPSRRLASTVGGGSPSGRGATFGLGMSRPQTVAAANRKVAALTYSARSTGCVEKYSKGLPSARLTSPSPAKTAAATGALP